MSIRFVIWFEERSGSTFLRSLLKKHPQVLCLGECFGVSGSTERGNRRQISGLGASIEDPSPREAIAFVKKLFAHRQRAVGFKFKHPAQQRAYPEIARYLVRRRRSIRLIKLKRDNYLKRAVSRQNLERIQARAGASNLTDSDHLAPLRLNVRRALGYMRRAHQRQTLFESLASRFSARLEVEYEELLADTKVVLDRVLAFLEVEQQIELSTVVAKATHDDLREALENYDELAAALKGTPFARFLDED